MSNVTQEEVIVNTVIHPQNQNNLNNSVTNSKIINLSCCCFKNRIFLSHNHCCSTYISILIYLIIPITSFNVLAFPKIDDKLFKILSFIIGDLILVISLLSFFNVVTSSPGYENLENKITKSEFIEKNPEVRIKGKVFKLKFCDTCNIVRQLRTHHCRFCNKCVLVHDHHCGFVNNCIGKNNRLKFLFFLFFADFYCLFCCVFSIIFVIKNKNINIVILIYMILIGVIGGGVFLMMAPFTFQHLIYISINKTTREKIKNFHYNNVLNNGCFNNWKEVCCN